MKYYALYKGIKISSKIVDRFFEYATINPAKNTRSDPQGHGGF